MREQILTILKGIKPTKDLSQIDNIIEGGYLDSFEFMALIAELNTAFDIEIDLDDMEPANFNSVDAMAAMIQRHKS